MKTIALAGGVGGAKLAYGLAQTIPFEDLSIIVNTGDDMDLFGLHISPDLDTVCYTLAEIANPDTGWGQENESWSVYETLIKLGAPDWFHLGDKDIALHMERTRLLKIGLTLTDVASHFCRLWNIKNNVFPMSDHSVRTLIHTKDHRILKFQEYFVREQCQPEVGKFEFRGLDNALPSEKVLNAIEDCELVIICPSNPWVSIDPIIKLQGIHQLLEKKKVVAISPIIGGKTIKGPAAKMYAELGIKPCAIAVANHYRDILSGFVMDEIDTKEASQIERWGIITLVTNTIMRSNNDRVLLAKEIVEFGKNLPHKG